jgi:hypothetical protein
MFINWYFLLCMFPLFGHLIEDNKDPGSKYLANDFSGLTDNVVERRALFSLFFCGSSWVSVRTFLPSTVFTFCISATFLQITFSFFFLL